MINCPWWSFCCPI